MNKIFKILVLFSFFGSSAQTYVKFNAASALIAIPQIGIETRIGEKWTFQADVLASFWESFNGKPLRVLIVTPEVRYHFTEIDKGFYLGGNISGGTFKLQKYGYKETNDYQQGYNYIIGITAGYNWKINEKFVLDFFIGAGHQEAFYKGYDLTTGERYDTWIHDYNKSGEFIPYRGGIMLAYKIK